MNHTKYTHHMLISDHILTESHQLQMDVESREEKDLRGNYKYLTLDGHIWHSRKLL